MRALNTVDVLDSIVPISRFNKGEANKIFSDVKKYGTRIVVKNNVPECVLMSPQSFQNMIEEYEDAILDTEIDSGEYDIYEINRDEDNNVKEVRITNNDNDDDLWLEL